MEKTGQEVNVDYLSFEIVNGLLICTYKSDLEIDIEIAKEIVRKRLKLIGDENKIYPTLIDGRGLKSIDKKSRDYFSSEEARKGIAAVALLAGSVFTKFIGNFFLKISYDKPTFPTKLFTDETKALQWLEQFKEE